MHLATWLAFALAAAVMGLIPGPGVTSIVGYALSSGRRTALASVAGIGIGNVICMTVSLAGAGAVLAASALAFAVLKWAGALYLIGLGVLAIVRSHQGLDPDTPTMAPITPRAAFFSNVLLGVFHPKTIVFFAAFAPQFISPDASYVAQAMLLIVTYTAVIGCTDTTYALAASRAAHLLKSPRATLWSKRAGGGVLIAAGLATAAASRR
ncbi:LysE family translocator [Phenylobacterium sp.]|uniref:LysE family translocator n=1 Tax=Phenylobacterium sp. TaxID=1871053 RepID=UPI00374D247C